MRDVRRSPHAASAVGACALAVLVMGLPLSIVHTPIVCVLLLAFAVGMVFVLAGTASLAMAGVARAVIARFVL